MLGICCLCLAQHYSEGFYFFFFSKSSNRTCQHWGATQLCKERLGWQWHSCRGLGWALLVQQGWTQRPLCHRTHQGGSDILTLGRPWQALPSMLPQVWWRQPALWWLSKEHKGTLLPQFYSFQKPPYFGSETSHSSHHSIYLDLNKWLW